MRWTYTLTACVTAWLAGAVAADAQQVPPPRIFVPSPPEVNPAPAAEGPLSPPVEPPAVAGPPPVEPPAVAGPPPVEPPAIAGPPPGSRGIGSGPPDAEFAAAAVGHPVFSSLIDGVEAELGPADALGVAGPRPTMPGYGLEAESLPAEIAEDFYQAFPVPRFGPTPVANVRLLMDLLDLDNLDEWSNIRTFGWVEGGYTGASVGPGLLSVQPRQNRFGDEFLLNQIGWVIQKPLRQDQFDIGFKSGTSPAPTRPWAQPRAASAIRPATPTSGRTSATCTCRRTCRSSRTAAWTSRSAA